MLKKNRCKTVAKLLRLSIYNFGLLLLFKLLWAFTNIVMIKLDFSSLKIRSYDEAYRIVKNDVRNKNRGILNGLCKCRPPFFFTSTVCRDGLLS